MNTNLVKYMYNQVVLNILSGNNNMTDGMTDGIYDGRNDRWNDGQPKSNIAPLFQSEAITKIKTQLNTRAKSIQQL